MFGIDFSELIVCILVALFVIGPERLPETVRTLGLWVGRLKRSLRETRETIEQQLGVEDIRRQLHSEEMMRTLEDMQEEIETALNYERMGNKPAREHSVQPSDTPPSASTPPPSNSEPLSEASKLLANESSDDINVSQTTEREQDAENLPVVHLQNKSSEQSHTSAPAQIRHSVH